MDKVGINIGFLDAGASLVIVILFLLRIFIIFSAEEAGSDRDQGRVGQPDTD